MKIKKIVISLFILFVGIIIGGYIFRDTQPRSFLRFDDCDETCLESNELLGLIGSVVAQKSPELIPSIVKETDKTIAIDSPIHRAPIHYVIIPKKDIKDIADLTQEDKEYLADSYAVIGEIIREAGLREYKVYTNGPSYQTVNYLHFHILAEESEN